VDSPVHTPETLYNGVFSLARVAVKEFLWPETQPLPL
jgi:hypothetical protein